MRSLRARITAAATIILATVLALASIVIVTLVGREVRLELAEQNENTLSDIVAMIEEGEDPRRFSMPLGSDSTEFAILTSDGSFINASIVQVDFFTTEVVEFDGAFFQPGDIVVGPDGSEFVVPGDGVLATSSSVEPIFDDEILTDFFLDQPWEVTERPAIAPDGTSYAVQALSPLNLVDRNVDQVRSVLWLIIPLLTAIFGGLVWLVTGRVLRPVDEMTAKASAISADTLHERLEAPGTNDEIDRLATTLNHMLSRLDRGAQAQKQFVSDASHELQSPLTVLLGEAELASGHPERLERANGLVLEHGRRMSGLIQDLLDLSRYGEVQPQRVEVDLDDILRSEARLHPATIRTLDITPVRMIGDPGRLGRVVRNLIDNAHRHGGSTISVACHRNESDGAVVLIVEDDGPGIPIDQRKVVFDRFSRLDPSRHRTTGGSGLGLAIAKSIVDSHGGTIEIGDSPLGGARFRIELPEAGPA